MVMRLPEGDRISVSREKLKADIAVAMGGRVAEELIFGHEKVTAGAASDIEQATKIARHMVTHWGMSDKLGPMSYGENQQEVFLGHSITQQKNISEATAQLIDGEVRQIVEEGYATAQKLISTELGRLHDLASALLEHETLTGEEIGAILRGDPMPKSAPPPQEPGPAPSGGKRGSVPTTARPKGDAPGGMEPSPQPGA
jgi:cell division protease FtsH